MTAFDQQGRAPVDAQLAGLEPANEYQLLFFERPEDGELAQGTLLAMDPFPEMRTICGQVKAPARIAVNPRRIVTT
jgi:hypothetical protein